MEHRNIHGKNCACHGCKLAAPLLAPAPIAKAWRAA